MLKWITLLAAALLSVAVGADTVPEFDARVLERKPFERRNFVQGLEFHQDTLMVSSGLYGESALRIYRWPDLSLAKDIPLPRQIFAEGLTRLQDRIYVLTWRARAMLVFDADTLELTSSARIPGQGWGITHDGERLFFSDGSDRLFSVDPNRETTLSTLRVRLNGRPVRYLNELEWVDGEIWANVWQSDRILRIDPGSGEVTGVIHLKGLLAPEDRRQDTDVLNGIARDPATGDIWVTGKRWPWLFKIALEPRD